MTCATTERKTFTEHLPPALFEKVSHDKANNRMTVRGRIQLAGVKNGNGRVYPEDLWERICRDREFLERVGRLEMRGVVEHPETGVTDLKEASHIMTKVWKAGQDVLGEALVLNTPTGRIIQELVDVGSPVGISSRGEGSSSMKDGVEVIGEDFRPETWDFVDKPSTPGAYMQKVEALGAAYCKEASVDKRQNEIMRLQLRAHEITENLGNGKKLNLDDVAAELAEAEARLNILRVECPEDTEAETLITESVAAVGRARDGVADARDRAFTERARVLEAKTDLTTKKRTKTESSRETSQEDETPGEDLASQWREQYTYWRERAEEQARRLREGVVPQSTHQAAEQLLVAVVERNSQLEAKLREVQADLEETRDSYESAETMLADVVERNDRARILSRMREAFEDYPFLIKFKETLEQADNLEDLEAMLQNLSSGLKEMGDYANDDDDDEMGDDDEDELGEMDPDLDGEDDDEFSMDGGDDDDDDEMGDDDEEESEEEPVLAFESSLPSKDSSPNQPGKFPGEGTPRSLTESADPTAHATHEALRRRGWK